MGPKDSTSNGHRRRDRLPQYQRHRRPSCAALDLGSNNCRLLVAEPAQGGFHVVDAFSRIVRLGEGIERHGKLSEAAMERTIDALKVCAAKMRRRRVASARSVATEACRRASNGNEFLDRVRCETGLDIEIISTAEEAALALSGCTPLLEPGSSFALVFDIGGGSTELMWVDCGGSEEDFRILESASLPIGVINLSEIYGADRLAPEMFEAMVAKVVPALESFDHSGEIRGKIGRGEVQMLGTSGTVTTLAGINLGLPSYDRDQVDGCFMAFEEARAVNARLLALDCKGRAAVPCIGPSRADLVLAGCAILEAILRTWPVGRLRVADRGLREGILLDLMGGGRSGSLVA